MKAYEHLYRSLSQERCLAKSFSNPLGFSVRDLANSVSVLSYKWLQLKIFYPWMEVNRAHPRNNGICNGTQMLVRRPKAWIRITNLALRKKQKTKKTKQISVSNPCWRFWFRRSRERLWGFIFLGSAPKWFWSIYKLGNQWLEWSHAWDQRKKLWRWRPDFIQRRETIPLGVQSMSLSEFLIWKWPDSLKLTMGEILKPQKLANAINQGISLP